MVSIHAPRAPRPWLGSSCFNPRAPCGARQGACSRHAEQREFQSTRPVRGATPARFACQPVRPCFNPRAPCGARPGRLLSPFTTALFQSTRPVRGATTKSRCAWRNAASFNPRAPCGARRHVVGHVDRLAKFQSTRPVRGATSDAVSKVIPPIKVSIHAPRAGRDLQSQR